MMSHLPPVSAGMIVSKTEFSICAGQAEARRNALRDIGVGARWVAVLVEVLLRRIGQVRQTMSLPWKSS